jgi:hypothetical protein
MLRSANLPTGGVNHPHLRVVGPLRCLLCIAPDSHGDRHHLRVKRGPLGRYAPLPKTVLLASGHPDRSAFRCKDNHSREHYRDDHRGAD